MDKWDPLDFVWPRLHAAMQTQDEEASDKADAAWEEASGLYSAYLKSVSWPEGVVDHMDKGCLHDARVVDWWRGEKKCILTLRQDNGAWDGRDYVAVVEWDVRQVVRDESDGGDDGDGASYWLYDQLADLGDGVYRHHLYLTSGIIVLDFTAMRVTRVLMDPA